MYRPTIILAVLCAVALLGIDRLPLYEWCSLGSPVLTGGPATVEMGTRSSAFDLAGGQHYLVQMQGFAAQAFRVTFAYPDGTHSETLTVDRRKFSSGRPFRAVIKPKQSVQGASLEFSLDNKPLPDGIRLDGLKVQALSRAFYLWDKVVVAVRWAAIIGVLAAILRLLWLATHEPGARRRVQGSLATTVPLLTDRQQGMVAFCAGLLLLVGGLAEPFFIEQKLDALLDKNFPTPAVKGWDDSFYFFWLRSVMVDGDVDFSNDLLYCNTLSLPKREMILRETPRTKTGLFPNKYPIGWALVEVPWYLAADAGAHAANLTGAHIPYDGWHPLYQAVLVLGQMVYALAGLYFAYRFVANYLPGVMALCGVLLAWLGSALFYYQTLGVVMSHNTMFFAVTAAHWFTLRLRRHSTSTWNWALVGGLCALVILARYQGAVLLLFPGVVCLRLLAENFRQMAPRFLLATAVGTLLLSLQMLAWKLVFGSFFLYTYAGETFSWLHPHVWESWFSPLHGLFYWHPAVLVALVGFILWAVRTEHRVDALCFAGSLGLMLYVNAAWDCWWFGAAFGARAFDGSMLSAMLGLAALLGELLRWRAAAFSVAVGGLFALSLWNLNLVLLAYKSRIEFERPMTWSKMAHASVKYWTK